MRAECLRRIDEQICPRGIAPQATMTMVSMDCVRRSSLSTIGPFRKNEPLAERQPLQ